MSEALRNIEIARGWGYSWLDFVAGYGLLGMLGVVVGLGGAALFAGVERGSKLLLHRIAPRFEAAPTIGLQSITFGLFFAIWLNIVRLLLQANQIKVAEIPPFYQLLALLILGSVIFICFKTTIVVWMESLNSSIKLVILLAIIFYTASTTYLILEPQLNKGKPAPVALQNPNHTAPNVILIILDSLTSRDMSLYGYHLPTTPNLERISKTWTVYENAHSTGTGTLAVMPTMLTGRYPYLDIWHQYGDLAREGEGWLSLASSLQSLGYKTAYFRGEGFIPGMYHLHAGWEWFEGGMSKVPGRYFLDLMPGSPSFFLSWLRLQYDPRSPQAPLLYTTAAPKLSSSTTTTLWSEPMYGAAKQYFTKQAALKEDSFFAYFHMNRPHFPYIANEFMGSFLPVKDGFTTFKSQTGLVSSHYSPDQQPNVDKLRLRYDENILKADQEVGQLIENLQQLGLYDQSLIIITADHGTNFTNGYFGYYTPLLAASEHSIPLLVKYPEQTQGKRVANLVSNVDILPTVLDTIGINYPPAWVDGQSLLKVDQTEKRIVYVRRPGDAHTFAAIQGKLKLVQRKDSLKLFDLAADPDEKNDLLGKEEAPLLQAALKQYESRMKAVREGEAILQAPALSQP